MINAKNDDLEAVSDEMSKDPERNVKVDSDDLDKSLEVNGMPCMCLFLLPNRVLFSSFWRFPDKDCFGVRWTNRQVDNSQG